MKFKNIPKAILMMCLALLLSGCVNDGNSKEQSEINSSEEKDLCEHIYEKASCTNPKTCINCGDTLGEPLGHSIIIDEAIEPTHLLSGKTEGKHCEECGLIIVEQQEVEKLAHKLEVLEAVASTCINEGKTEGLYCATCDIIITPQTILAKEEHFLVGDTCEKCQQRIYINKWDASSNQDGSIIVYMYNTSVEGEYALEVVGNGRMKDYETNDSRAPWDGRRHKNIVSLKFIGDITYIGEASFVYLSIKEVKLPESLIEIGNDAFMHCDLLKEVTISNKLQVLGDGVFVATALKELRVPDSVDSIKGIIGADIIYLPRNITIKDGIGNAEKIYYAGTIEQWLKTGDTANYFYEDQIIHCTDGDYLNPGNYRA